MADENLLGQADALIRRHRSFVARGGASSTETLPAQVDTPEVAETEIPLLTEVVAAAQPAQLTASMRAALENELDGWIDEILPAVVANASQGLLAELETQTRHTLLPHLLEILENGTRQKL